jgi:hypothetical protein
LIIKGVISLNGAVFFQGVFIRCPYGDRTGLVWQGKKVEHETVNCSCVMLSGRFQMRRNRNDTFKSSEEEGSDDR